VENGKLSKQHEVKKIITTPIDFHPKLEKISTVISIKGINEDFSHPDGFQVTFYGETYAMGDYVEIVNLYGVDEKQYVDEIISTITPGSSWLITGEYIIDMRTATMTVFPGVYQVISETGKLRCNI